MLHRINIVPWATDNDSWNDAGQLDATPDKPYRSQEVVPITEFNVSLKEELFQKICINIINETVFDYPNPRLSEKTWKTLVNQRMFVMVGPANSLSHLKDLGFKTFSPFINEDYDNILDPVARMREIYHEIDRLCAIPLDDVKQQVLEYKDRIEHNYHQLRKLEQEDMERFKKLCSN